MSSFKKTEIYKRTVGKHSNKKVGPYGETNIIIIKF